MKHKLTGMDKGPRNEMEMKFWELHTNKPHMWDVYKMFNMKANRAVWYPSDLMHRAEPVGGFGDDEQDGRLVYTMFFNKEKKDDTQSNT